jgi:hypothetical protein
MRQDEKGNFITLEEDIRDIWTKHGLVVIAEEVKSLQPIGLEGSVWTIKAKVKK